MHRPHTAYQLYYKWATLHFAEEIKAKVAQAQDDSRAQLTVPAKFIGAKWRMLPADEKQPFDADAAKERATWNDAQSVDTTPTSRAGSEGSSEGSTSIAAPTAAAAAKPKRPPNVFTIFSRRWRDENAEEVKRIQAEEGARQVPKVISAKWKSMTEEEKDPFKQEAKRVAQEHRATFGVVRRSETAPANRAAKPSIAKVKAATAAREAAKEQQQEPQQEPPATKAKATTAKKTKTKPKPKTKTKKPLPRVDLESNEEFGQTHNIVVPAPDAPAPRDGSVCILSIDPGARRPGIACVRVAWGDEADAEWPHITPLVLMGDPLVPSSVKNVKTRGSTRVVTDCLAYFQAHAAALFGAAPDVAVIETQKGLNNRLIDKLSVAMFVECKHAAKLFGAPEAMRTVMCPATWKTNDLGVLAGTANYNARKEATVAKTQELLRGGGFGATADVLVGHEAERDISDAFMQAVQYFMHTHKRKGTAKPAKQAAAVVVDDDDGSDSEPDVPVTVGNGMSVPSSIAALATQLSSSS